MTVGEVWLFAFILRIYFAYICGELNLKHTAMFTYKNEVYEKITWAYEHKNGSLNIFYCHINQFSNWRKQEEGFFLLVNEPQSKFSECCVTVWHYYDKQCHCFVYFKICEIYNLSEYVFVFLSFWLAMRKWEVENFAIYFYSILDINSSEHH